MLPEIHRRFSDAVLREVLERLAVSPDDCASLGGFESHVFRLPGRVLKITHSLRRREEALMGEVEYLEHLAERGVPVARALPFPSGRFVETVSDGEGGHFLAYHFVEAPGAVARPEDWDEAHIRRWGQLSGRINRVSREFAPSTPARARPRWDEEPMLRFAEHFPPERVESLARAEALLGHLRGLPRGPETHGLTHGDLHQGNLHRAADGSLMAFDFDDCVYHHAVSEVAVVLYYATGRGAQGQGAAAKAQLAEHFLEHFLGGYMTEDTLTRAQLEQLPDWLLLRSALLTSVVETNVVTHLEDKAKALDMYHGRLEGKEAVIELDFGRLARVWGR